MTHSSYSAPVTTAITPITILTVLHYLLKGISLLTMVTLAPMMGAEPLGSGPINYSFSPAQLHGESYIFKFVQTPNGQLIAGGERVLFYHNNEWQPVIMPKTRGCRGLLVVGDTLWVASLGEIGKLKLPLHANSTYERLKSEEISKAGEFWDLNISGDFVVGTTKDAFWFINSRTDQISYQSVPYSGRLMAISWGDQLLVSQPRVGIWQVIGNRATKFENPLPNNRDNAWLWGNGSLLLGSQALYRRSTSGFEAIVDTSELNRTNVIATATAWEGWLAAPTIRGGLALISPEQHTISFVRRGAGIPTLMLYTAFADREGRLWIGHKEGITVVESLRVGRQTVLREPALDAKRMDGLWLNYEDQAEYHRADGTSQTLQRAFKLIPTRHGPMFGMFAELQLNEKKSRFLEDVFPNTSNFPMADCLSSQARLST